VGLVFGVVWGLFGRLVVGSDIVRFLFVERVFVGRFDLW